MVSSLDSITEPNSKLKVTFNNYNYSFNYKLTIGDEVVEGGTAEYNSMYGYASFTSSEHEVTGNVVLTITPVE